MPKREYKKTRADLIVELRDQYDDLTEANKAYDGGNLRKAKNISSVVCKLFHDGGRGRSLVTQLGVRRKILIPDGLNSRRGRKDLGLPLCLLSAQPVPMRTSYIPLCYDKKYLNEDPMHSLCSTWWSGTVYRSKEYNLTRGQLVRAMRNTEADHIDAVIKEEAYVAMKTEGCQGYRTYVCEGGAVRLQILNGPCLYILKERPPKGANSPPVISGPHSIPNAEFATMRQIGWEVETAVASVLALLKVTG